VLDDAGKIIARLYPRALNLNVAPPVSINGNTASSSIKVVTSDTWNRSIWQTPTPFSISAANGKLNFTFADGSITNVNPFDSTAHWQKPRTLRIFYYHFHPNWGYGLEIGLSDVVFSAH
jgi:prepilin-type processing-associated H-X9-DG protein